MDRGLCVRVRFVHVRVFVLQKETRQALHRSSSSSTRGQTKDLDEDRYLHPFPKHTSARPTSPVHQPWAPRLNDYEPIAKSPLPIVVSKISHANQQTTSHAHNATRATTASSISSGTSASTPNRGHTGAPLAANHSDARTFSSATS